MTIRHAAIEDVALISNLANQIWWPAYQDILSIEQIKFMLDKMYSVDSLEEEMAEGITFLIAESKQPLGFASYSLSDDVLSIYKIHKLYLLTEVQGQGFGRKFLDYIRKEVNSEGGKILELNVNRDNPAFQFYKKYGFEVFAENDIPYYSYILNDYIMRMPV